MGIPIVRIATTVVLSRCSSAIRPKMSSWIDGKQRILNLPLVEKRKLYKSSKHTELKDIPTWAETGKGFSNRNLAEKISLFSGDITTLEVDAIVNAANKSLQGGGGVDGAIHSAAGPLLVAECRTLNGCETGHAKITGGYKLPAKYVIHTVGPVGEKPGLLQQCYKNSLDILSKNKLRSIAFPCISTGIYGYPNEPAAEIAVAEVKTFLQNKSDEVDRVIFCTFLDVDMGIYERLLQSI